MAKRKHTEEEEAPENSERWLLTYADMITLLVAFFIMMYSMSVLNLKKFKDIAVAIRSGFGGQASGKKGNYLIEKSWSIVGQDRAIPSMAKPADETTHGRGVQEYPQNLKTQYTIYRYIATQLANLKLDETLQPILDITESTGNRFVVILSDQIYFDSGKSSLNEESKAKLRDIGEAIRDGGYKVTLSGYSSPFTSNSLFRSSWDLSTERACEAALFLMSDMKINPRRLSVAGYGEWKDPGKSQRVAFTSDGEWKNLEVKSSKDTEQDRVVVSMMLE
jgi:chemotaxis protein MotB